MEKTTEIKEAFRYLHEHEAKLSLNQIDFLRSLKKYFSRNGKLSTRQEKALFDIKKFLNIV